MQEPKPLRVGDPRHVGTCRLLGLLGEGGQGTVYRGEAPTGEHVAVKLLHARFSEEAKARARFAQELAHARQVAPFCTARILDADVEGDRPYIVSEFIDGPTLSELIINGRVPDGPALDGLAIATVTALAAIHEAGIVHRDSKPGNVIIDYMAPEQFGGEIVGPAADVFAWGCTLAHAVNGVAPFGQDSIPAVMHRVMHVEPDLGKMTGPLRDIVTACLAKDPAHRPTSRQILLRLLGAKESSAAHETLLTEGAQASAHSSPHHVFNPVRCRAVRGGTPVTPPLGGRLNPRGNTLRNRPTGMPRAQPATRRIEVNAGFRSILLAPKP
jgi:serine/threonine protein kinase